MDNLNFEDLIYKIPNAISDDMCDHLMGHHTKIQNRGAWDKIIKKRLGS